jgi:hypothetical protein
MPAFLKLLITKHFRILKICFGTLAEEDYMMKIVPSNVIGLEV